MNKKLIISVASFLLVISLIVGFAIFAYVKFNHEHTLEHIEAKASDCVTDGNIEHWFCDGCDKYFSDKDGKVEIDASNVTTKKLGHTSQINNAIEPTCTDPGITYGEQCSVCYEIIIAQSAIPAKGHVGGEWIIQKEPSHTEEGYKYKICSVCNNEAENLAIPLLGHELIPHEGQAATCEADGWKEYSTCSECSYSTYTAIPAKGHSNVAVETRPSTCTIDGYAKKVCADCTRSDTEDLFATGHNYGAWTVESQPTCTLVGKKAKVCAKCNDKAVEEISATAHNYVAISETIENECEYTTYQCENCPECIKLEGSSSLESTISDQIVTDCDTDFSFNIISDLSENEIHENLKIFDAYFENTEYEDYEGVVCEYNLINVSGNAWKIEPKTLYEEGNTYIAQISNGVKFADYNASKLTFTTKQENTNKATISDDLIFIKTLEKESPGYYPYELSYSETSEYIYLRLHKVDGLSIGSVICAGDVETLEEILAADPDSFCFGKIATIDNLNNGEWRVTLSEPDLEEIFSDFDYHQTTEVNFDTMDVEFSEDLEQKAIESLYASEDFVNFLATVNLSSQRYLEARGLNSSHLKKASFMNMIDIKPSCTVNGTKVLITLNGTITVPLSPEDSESDLGNIKIWFTAEAELSFKINATCKLKYWWFIPTGIKKFDVGVNQSDRFKFEFGLSIDVEYSLADREFCIYTTQTGKQTLHIDSCRRLSMPDIDKSKIKAITKETLLQKYMEENIGECGSCRPVMRLGNTHYFVNENSKKIHMSFCKDLKNVTVAKITISDMTLDQLVARKYSICLNCHPEHREDCDFFKQSVDDLTFVKWADKVAEIKQWAAKSNVEEYSGDGWRLCRLWHPVGLFTLNLDINVILDFELSASIDYKYEITHSNSFGIRLQSGKLVPYKSSTSKVLQNTLKAMGESHFKLGVQADAYVSLVGLSSLVRAGVTAEVGVYADMAGIINISNTEDNYAAAYLDCGVYLDIEAYYKILFLGGDIDILDKKMPILQYGYDKAYYSFVNDPERLYITENTYTLDAKDFLTVQYFDLKTMTDKTETLSFNGVDGKYSVIITLEKGTHCTIKNGKLVFDAQTPIEYTDTLTITVIGKSDWRKYIKGSGAFYLEQYTVDLMYVG